MHFSSMALDAPARACVSASRWLGLAQRFMAVALAGDYISSGHGHRQSRQVLLDRRRGAAIGTPRTALGHDAEQAYLARLSRRRRLTSSEEYRLACRMCAGDEAARNALVEAHLGLVVMFARRWQRPGVPLIDLIAEGNIGLIAATRHFDPERGCRFSTYAKWPVQRALQQALPRLVSAAAPQKLVPPADVPGAADLDLAAEAPADEGEPAGAAARGGWPSSAAEELAVLCIPETEEPPQQAHVTQQRQELARALQGLAEREREVITRRFELAGQEGATLDVLARRFGVSIERIRQVEAAALRKLGRLLLDAGQSAQSLL